MTFFWHLGLAIVIAALLVGVEITEDGLEMDWLSVAVAFPAFCLISALILAYLPE